MKFFFILIVSTFIYLNGDALENVDFDKDNFNLLCVNPLLSQKDVNRVSKAIDKGYRRQLINLANKVKNISDIRIKHFQHKKMKKSDKKASAELLEMLKVINDYFERNDKEKPTEKVKKNSDDGFSDNDELDFDETVITELTKKGESTEDKYKTSLVDTLDELSRIYKTEKDDGWYIPYRDQSDVENLKTNVIFAEYFNPAKEGRRYILSINIFIFIIDSDGDARVMSKVISAYNWKRNHRYISAQSSQIIQDTIAKMTGIDIK